MKKVRGDYQCLGDLMGVIAGRLEKILHSLLLSYQNPLFLKKDLSFPFE